MRDAKLLEMALGLAPPWRVVKVGFNTEDKRLDIFLDFPKGSRFICPSCGESCAVYDTEERQWRHLNFFEHECYLNARVPRTECDRCGVHVVEVPWSRSQSGFTLLFEALVMILSREMPVKAVSRLIGETDNRIWRVIEHHVDEAHQGLDFSNVEHVGMDETSRRRGHRYLTLFVDMDERRVIDVERGKGSEAVERFVEDFRGHGGDPEKVSEVCCDMSPAFISGVEAQMPGASITYDRYHVMKVLGRGG